MTRVPPTPTATPQGQHLEPHRGTLILVFGILSLIVCVIFGIVSWVMANADLSKMEAGVMDPSGRGMTQAGKILGIISVVSSIVVVCFGILALILFLVTAARTAGSGP